MPLTPVWLPSAALDLEDATAWYEERRAGLGESFRAATAAALESVTEFPASHPLAAPGLRMVMLRHFPFHLCYRVKGDRVMVVALLHTRRGEASLPNPTGPDPS